MTLATILEIHRNYGLCDYIMDVWEEGKYCKPLEITRKFSNDQAIMEAGRVKSTAMKPFQRMLHFFVIKNLLPRFGKRGTTSFIDLTYMQYMTAKLPINLPRLMIRHTTYVISVPHHELPYGDLLTRVFKAFEVPLNDKEGEDPIKTDLFEETFLIMAQLKRKNGMWWLGIGANRRRDDIEVEAENAEIPTENEEVNEGGNQEENVGWETENEEEVVPKDMIVETDVQVQGEKYKDEAKTTGSGSAEQFFDAMDEVQATGEDVLAPVVPAASAQTSVQ
ncbi:hypothetical protein Dimus_003990 [Dionaea muscipula]